MNKEVERLLVRATELIRKDYPTAADIEASEKCLRMAAELLRKSINSNDDEF